MKIEKEKMRLLSKTHSLFSSFFCFFFILLKQIIFAYIIDIHTCPFLFFDIVQSNNINIYEIEKEREREEEKANVRF
jgi:hypothetical protein